MAEPELIELLRRLVRTPSVNPTDTGNAAIGGEERMARQLAEELAAKGFAVELDEAGPGRPNLVATLGEPGAGRTLAFEGHLDTVSIDGMTVAPFAGEVRTGRLYGRGACDMKGAMAAALHALNAERLGRWREAGLRLLFIGAIDEEKGCGGARMLARQKRFRADELIVLEPTELGIVHAHKGALWYEIEVFGRTAHGASPGEGFSAIRSMVPVMEVVEAEARAAAAAVGASATGEPTVNIGVIEGGSGVNTVPGSCRIQVDRRTVPGENHERILEAIRRGLRQCQAEGTVLRWELRPRLGSPAYDSGADTGLARRLAAAAERCGVVPRLGGTGWYSDAGPLSRLSGATVVFGPGSIVQAHTADEYIELESLQQGADILGAFLDATLEEWTEGG